MYLEECIIHSFYQISQLHTYISCPNNTRICHALFHPKHWKSGIFDGSEIQVSANAFVQ